MRASFVSIICRRQANSRRTRVGNNNNNNIFEKETKGDGGVGHQNRKKLDLLLGWFYFIFYFFLLVWRWWAPGSSRDGGRWDVLCLGDANDEIISPLRCLNHGVNQKAERERERETCGCVIFMYSTLITQLISFSSFLFACWWFIRFPIHQPARLGGASLMYSLFYLIARAKEEMAISLCRYTLERVDAGRQYSTWW